MSHSRLAQSEHSHLSRWSITIRLGYLTRQYRKGWKVLQGLQVARLQHVSTAKCKGPLTKRFSVATGRDRSNGMAAMRLPCLIGCVAYTPRPADAAGRVGAELLPAEGVASCTLMRTPLTCTGGGEGRARRVKPEAFAELVTKMLAVLDGCADKLMSTEQDGRPCC